jgi:hypothetical protein
MGSTAAVQDISIEKTEDVLDDGTASASLSAFFLNGC